jgi:hypothetical protein
LSRRVRLAAAAVGAAMLAFGSVHSTGALWNDSVTVAGATVTAGSLSLATGSGAGTAFTFDALKKDPVTVGQIVQAPLIITNTGTTSLKFQLVNAGPKVVAPAGAAVTVSLQGAVLTGSTVCDGTTAMGSAFPNVSASAAATVVAGIPHTLSAGESQTWCVRSILTAAPSAPSVTYRHDFSFTAVQAE